MPVDLPPEVIEEAAKALYTGIGYGGRADDWDTQLLDGTDVWLTASRNWYRCQIQDVAPVIAAYVRAQTIAEVRAVVEPFQIGTEVSDAIDRLAEEES